MAEIDRNYGDLSIIPNVIPIRVFRELDHGARKCAISRAVMSKNEGLSRVPRRKFPQSGGFAGRKPSRASRSPGWHGFCPIGRISQNVQAHTVQNVLIAHRFRGVSTHTPLKTKRFKFGTRFAHYKRHEHAQDKQNQAVGRGGRLVGRGQRQCRETPRNQSRKQPPGRRVNV